MNESQTTIKQKLRYSQRLRLHWKSHKRFITISALLGTFFLFLFFAFTVIVRTDLLRSFDFNTTVRLQDRTPLRIDPFFSFLSVIGRFEFTLALLVLLLLIRRKIVGIIIFCMFGAAHVIELIGKLILEQPGPPHMFLRSHYSDFPGLYVHTKASYPSGHSMRAVILGIIIVFLTWHIKKLPLLFRLAFAAGIVLLIIAILYSRVSLGEHWTTDVIGGSILGAAVGILALIFL